MRKKTLYGLWNKFGDVSLLILIILFMITAAISIAALRDNNLTMSKLRQAVYTADEKNGDVETALKNLRIYVYSHMNTNLRAGSSSDQPPIQLVNKFNRAVEAEQARIAALGNANKVYVDAQAVCERASIPLTARAQCIQEYVTANGKTSPQLQLPPKEVYTFDFASPKWSPDLAGWSIVATIFIGIFIIVRLVIGISIKRSLR